MKTKMIKVAVIAITIVALLPQTWAQLNIPSDGSDGALVITSNTVVDLSQAVTGNWDADNSANAGKGIYDPNKWAVVFKYSSVSISNGATLTFLNHPAHAPVVWLVANTVANNGILNLNGEFGDQSTARLREGGPGGFRGGAREQSGIGVSGGFGPGGAFDSGGQYGSGQARSYGSDSVIPLIGGSGGSAGVYSGNYGNYRVWNGGGGGGAILIVASESITISGTGKILANGGSSGSGYSGSGGAIRLVADQILGSGRIEATGGNVGRVRLEGNVVSQSLDILPPSPSVVPSPIEIWPPASAAEVRITSISGGAVPSDPRAVMENSPPDITIGNTNLISILLETSNFPTNGSVTVTFKPRNSAQVSSQATFVSGDTNLGLWQVQRSLPLNYTVIQARAVGN